MDQNKINSPPPLSLNTSPQKLPLFLFHLGIEALCLSNHYLPLYLPSLHPYQYTSILLPPLKLSITLTNRHLSITISSPSHPLGLLSLLSLITISHFPHHHLPFSSIPRTHTYTISPSTLYIPYPHQHPFASSAILNFYIQLPSPSLDIHPYPAKDCPSKKC